jgi:hypothetical protein
VCGDDDRLALGEAGEHVEGEGRVAGDLVSGELVGERGYPGQGSSTVHDRATTVHQEE